ncbi:uncharacterized protein LOC132198908 isoform X2 [Neocloeon triangulifer]|nr:uncharacterized protein LOC132198908 isoform X2 [Neocloeon triangulifer]
MTEILQEAKRFKELTAVEPKIIEEKVQELMVKEYLISKRPGKSTIYTKKSSVEQILGDHFDMSNRSQADKTKEVAGLLRDEILRLPTNTTHFPSYSELDDPASKVPPLVREFLETVGGKRLGSALPLITACQILQKVVVARGYVSPIQLYLGAVIYQQFKSKRIINFCNKFGLTSAYTEILNLFKTNASQMPRILEGGYVQYGWDNLDISSFSFEGEVQLHHLIGLQIVSPRTAIDLQQPIPREPVKKVAEEFYNIQVLECPEEATTPMISLYEDVMPVKKDNRHDDFESECDSWLEQTTESHIGWKGWLEKEHGAQETANNAGFLITPRIQQPANNYSSLFTAMKATIGMCPVKNQNRVIFTVDNALYLKTLKIHINLRNTDVEIARIVPSLGPWHLWLNFLGAVGNIMRGSGIEDLIKVLYSNRTCGIILAGQDYQRGLRAHLLIHEGLLLLAKEENVDFEKLKERGPTSSLWCTYIKMITDLKRCIWAVKLAKFDDYLSATAQMLPIFHAAGHHHYARSVHMNIQVQREAVESLPEREQKLFKSSWAIRRTKHEFGASGVDLMVESEAIKRLKAPGGLPGKGKQPEVVAKFCRAAPLVAEVEKRLEMLCGMNQSESDHPERSSSRRTKDAKVLDALKQQLKKGDPFAQNSSLRNIFSGTVSEKSDAHQAYVIGMRSYKSFIGKPFEEVKLECKVVPMQKANQPSKPSTKDAPTHESEAEETDEDFNEMVEA